VGDRIEHAAFALILDRPLGGRQGDLARGGGKPGGEGGEAHGSSLRLQKGFAKAARRDRDLASLGGYAAGRSIKSGPYWSTPTCLPGQGGGPAKGDAAGPAT